MSAKKPTEGTAPQATLVRRSEGAIAIGQLADSLYDQRCVLQFLRGVFRELSVSVSMDKMNKTRDHVEFSPEEMNGLFLIMHEAITDLESSLDPEDEEVTA